MNGQRIAVPFCHRSMRLHRRAGMAFGGVGKIDAVLGLFHRWGEIALPGGTGPRFGIHVGRAEERFFFGEFKLEIFRRVARFLKAFRYDQREGLAPIMHLTRILLWSGIGRSLSSTSGQSGGHR